MVLVHGLQDVQMRGLAKARRVWWWWLKGGEGLNSWKTSFVSPYVIMKSMIGELTFDVELESSSVAHMKT